MLPEFWLEPAMTVYVVGLLAWLSGGVPMVRVYSDGEIRYYIGVPS